MKLAKKIQTALNVLRTEGWMGIWDKLNYLYGVPIPSRVRWKVGIKEEACFWDDYIKTGGQGGPKLFHMRLDPALPLQERPQALLPPRETVTILDVGAGPFTVLGKVSPGKIIEITAVDPLAKIYDEILSKYGIKPLVRTQELAGEHLLDKWSESTFDLVYARNCIDHAADPLLVIQQMIGVAKKGCYVLMEHIPNEAIREHYVGLHQWNFSMNEAGDFIVSSKSKQVNVTQRFQDIATVTCEMVDEFINLDVPTSMPFLIVRILKVQ
jgi:SAM-dependent methyltransferase